jgi:hypothetical protein
MNLLKAIFWVLGILVAGLFMPVLLIIASIVATIVGTISAIYIIKALYDLESDYEDS